MKFDKIRVVKSRLFAAVLLLLLLLAMFSSCLSSGALQRNPELPLNTRRLEKNPDSTTTTTTTTTTTVISITSNDDDKQPLIIASPEAPEAPSHSSSSSLSSVFAADAPVGGESRGLGKRLGGYPNSSSSVRPQKRGKVAPTGGVATAGFGALGSAKKNIIRGSDSAVVIARMTYLKKEMCQSEPLEQIVKEQGCIRRRFVNRFCYGQCNSFFIPRIARSLMGKVRGARRHRGRQQRSFGGATSQRSRPLLPQQKRRSQEAEDEDEEESLASSAFRSCSFCRPKTIEWQAVVLQCPNSKPPVRRMRIPVVKQCACVALSFDNNP